MSDDRLKKIMNDVHNINVDAHDTLVDKIKKETGRYTEELFLRIVDEYNGDDWDVSKQPFVDVLESFYLGQFVYRYHSNAFDIPSRHYVDIDRVKSFLDGIEFERLKVARK